MTQQPIPRAKWFLGHISRKEVNHDSSKEKVMNKLEDTRSGTTADKTEKSSESEKCQTRMSSGWGYRGDRGNTINNTRDSVASTNRDYKDYIEAFGDVLDLNYDKV